MTTEVIVLASSSLAGLSGGAIGSLLLLRYADTRPVGWLLGMRKAPTPTAVVISADGDVLSEQAGADRLAADFAQHAQAVRRQVTQYADLLADGDAVLRARLRRLEDGGTP